MRLIETPRAQSLARSRSNLRAEKRVACGTAPRVLIVDDDEATRLLFSINLQDEGFLVLQAEDGRRGLARALIEKPDLVVTDVKMPRLDGFELAEALRKDLRTRAIPLIFVTGEREAASEARARALGALAYLTKPVDAPSLASVVARVLAGGAPPPAPRAA